MARNLAKLGEYQLRARQIEQARASLSQAEHLAETTEEKMHLSEITRLLGTSAALIVGELTDQWECMNSPFAIARWCGW